MRVEADLRRHPPFYNTSMKKERMTTIWSLKRRDEVTVRIYYRVDDTGRGRIICLERVEQFE
jgi:hypothetical protein